LFPVTTTLVLLNLISGKFSTSRKFGTGDRRP
jgi:hypothetical protein